MRHEEKQGEVCWGASVKGALQVREGDREKLLIFFLWALPFSMSPWNSRSLRMKPTLQAAEQRGKEPGSSLSDGALRDLGL